MKFTLRTKYDILTVVGMQAGFRNYVPFVDSKDYTIRFQTISGKEVQRGEFETLEEAQKTMSEIWEIYREEVKMSEIRGIKEIVIEFEIN